MRKYWFVFSLYWQEGLAQRSTFFIERFRSLIVLISFYYLWSALLTCEVTRERTMLLRRGPTAWRLSEGPGREDGESLTHSIVRGYLSLPTVDGATIADPEIDELEQALPVHHRVTLLGSGSVRAEG